MNAEQEPLSPEKANKIAREWVHTSVSIEPTKCMDEEYVAEVMTELPNEVMLPAYAASRQLAAASSGLHKKLDQNGLDKPNVISNAVDTGQTTS